MAKERFMAEGTQGPEVTPPLGESPTGPGRVEGQPPAQVSSEQTPQRPWHISSEYDPKRATEYKVSEEGNYQVFTDPVTGKEVARILKAAGGAEVQQGPRKPEAGDKEWETSPERGRWLVEEIVRLRTTLSYEERYNAENAPYLRQLYEDLQKYVNTICKERNQRDAWDPAKAYKSIQEKQKENPEAVDLGPDEREQILKFLQEEGEQLKVKSQQRLVITEQGGVRSEADDEYLKSSSKEEHQKEIIRLTLAYESNDTLDNDLPEIERRLLIYFREAHRKGLLQGADEILMVLNQERIQTGELSADQAVALVEQGIRQANRDIDGLYKVNRSDPEIVALKNIWIPYLRWAEQRLSNAILSRQQPGYREGEFRLERETTEIGEALEDTKETYWQPGSWAGYYTVSAKTSEQFRIAAETFFHLIRQGSIGKSPEDVFKHLQNFKEAFGATGSREVERQKKNVQGERLTHKFMRELRQEFEAKSYIFLADYSNESYNPKTYNQAMTTLALHEGPKRMVRLIRAGEGAVGAFTYMFDKDALMEIFNNPAGERGELDIIAQHFLQDQIREMAIERGIGIRLKNYDPREGQINLANYEKYKNESVQELKKLPVSLRKSIELGRIQTELISIRGRIASGELTVEPDKGEIDFLSDVDRKIFISSLTESRSVKQKRANQERIGLHMPREELKALYEGFDGINAHIRNYQVFGNSNKELFSQLPVDLRKSIELGRIQQKFDALPNRVSLIQRMKNDEVITELSPEEQKAYMGAYEEADANFDIAFQMQGVSGEKVRRGRGFLYIDRNQYIQAYQAIEEKSARIEWLLGEFQRGKKLEEFGVEIQSFYSQLTNEEKTKTAQGLYGIDKKKFSAEKIEFIQIGWMLSEIKEGRRWDSFSREEQYLYYGLGKFDNDGKFKFKDQATENQVKDGTIQLIIPTDRENYIDHIPTYLAEKFVQCAVTLTKIQYANSSAKIRFQEVEKARAGAITELRKNGFTAKLKNTDGTPMKLKRPKDPDGVEVDFELATDPDNIYNRYTTHTYWGYQGENRHILLAPHIFEAAGRILRGESRPEDEDVLASMLIITDPTLNRVKEFGRDEIEREITLLQAAVNESYLDHVLINKELFKAILPKDGSRGKMRAGYNMEDWGGAMRFAMGIKELAASQPARLTRRLGAEIAIMPVYVDAMGSLWGQEGVYGACSTFADQIERYSHQGVVGQFGITKFIDMQHYAQVDLYNALIGSVQEGKHKEGLYMKPTNDNEVLHRFTNQVMAGTITASPQEQLEFLQQLRGTFGRLEEVLKVMRAMYSDTRNAGGALDLRKVGIFLDNGKYNPAIYTNSDIKMNTGTSRQLESDFYDEFTDWFLSEWPGGGGEIYPEELVWNRFLKERNLYVFDGKKSKMGTKTFKKWFFEKAGL